MELPKQPLTLEHPLVQARKSQWEAAQKRSPHSKLTLNFEELFEYFKANCVRQNAVAQEGGVSRERIRQLYNKWFRDLFEGKSGRERTRACTLEKNLVRRIAVEQDLFNDPFVKQIAEKAQAAGHKVEGIPMATAAIQMQSTRLRISGHLCMLSRLTNKWSPRGSKRWYAHTNLKWSSVEGHVLLLHCVVEGFPERTFVVPVDDVVRAYGRKNVLYFFLPTERLPIYNNKKSLLDYWLYEEAWHLLAPTPAHT